MRHAEFVEEQAEWEQAPHDFGNDCGRGRGREWTVMPS